MTLRVSVIRKNKSKGIKTWYARIADPEQGIEVYRSLGTTLKGEAQFLAAKALEDFRHKEIDITLERAFAEVVKDRELRGYDSKTMYMYNQAFNMLFELRDKLVADIKPEELSGIFAEKCEKLGASSYNCRHQYCTSIFSFCVEREWISRNPMKKVPKKKTVRNTFPFFWTVDQVNAILDHASTPELRITWALMAFAGLRKDEAANLSDGDIHDGYIHLVGKGDKMAKVPVSSRLHAELERYGKPLPHIHSLSSSVKVAARNAGIEFQGEATNHRFRHSFASNLIRAGADIKSVQLLMRHENVEITLNTYSHLLGADLEKAVDKIG